MSRVSPTPSAIKRARELLASGLKGKWNDAARRVAAGGVGWEREAIAVLAQQIEANGALQARFDALLANHAQCRARLEAMFMAEAEENERLRALLDERKPRQANLTGLKRLGLRP